MPTIFIKAPTHWTACINIHTPAQDKRSEGKAVMCQSPNKMFNFWWTGKPPDIVSPPILQSV